MFRLILIVSVFFGLFQACNPPVRLKPSKIETGLDSTYYAGHVEDAKSIDLREAQFLAKVKVGDLGVSLDCRYPDVLSLAKTEVRRIGGNLLVITEHTRNKVKSTCHKIKGDIYRISSLEGLESRIYWHPARPLLAGDLRGKVSVREGLPPLDVTISCRIGGDYFNEAILRTETIFWADSSSMPKETGMRDLSLRRAKLHFDLAELHARQLKSKLAALGRDVSAITGRYRDMTIRQQEALRQERQQLDLEFSQADPPQALGRWEQRVKGELAALQSFSTDRVIDLHKKRK